MRASFELTPVRRMRPAWLHTMPEAPSLHYHGVCSGYQVSIPWIRNARHLAA